MKKTAKKSKAPVIASKRLRRYPVPVESGEAIFVGRGFAELVAATLKGEITREDLEHEVVKEFVAQQNTEEEA